MPKVLITADTHIHPHRQDSRRTQDGLDCLQWIYDTAEKHGCCRVLHAGDFLHNRTSLNVFALSKASDIVMKSPVRTIIVLGNHDLWYEDKWCTHSLTPFKPWVDIIDSPRPGMEIEGIPVDFLPYTPHPSRHFSIFKEPSKVLISHLAVADAVLNARYNILSVEDDSKEKELLKIEDFSRWKKVWLGHYHYGQKLSNIVEYVGSPMQLTFGEAGQKKHVAIFDLETHDTQYIVNTISPQFHIIEDEKDIESLKLDNAYIQMRSSGPIESKFDLRKKMSESGAREIEFLPTAVDITKQTTKALANISQLFNDRNKLIEEFVDASDTSTLEKDLLKRIGMKIIS